MPTSRDQKKWARIKKEYLEGGIGAKALAKKYGVSYGALARTSAQEGWVAERERCARETTERLRAQVVDEATARDEVVLAITDELLQAIRAGVADGTLTGSARDVRDVTDALRAILQYGGEHRVQTLREQKARIDKLRAEAEARKQDDGDKTLRVVIDGPLADLAE